MSISGAIASSSTARGPRGSFQGNMGYRRPSQPKDPGDLGSGKSSDDKKKDPKTQQGNTGCKTKSTCIILVAMGIMTIASILLPAEHTGFSFHGNGG